MKVRGGERVQRRGRVQRGQGRRGVKGVRGGPLAPCPSLRSSIFFCLSCCYRSSPRRSSYYCHCDTNHCHFHCHCHCHCPLPLPLHIKKRIEEDRSRKGNIAVKVSLTAWNSLMSFTGEMNSKMRFKEDKEKKDTARRSKVAKGSEVRGVVPYAYPSSPLSLSMCTRPPPHQ